MITVWSCKPSSVAVDTATEEVEQTAEEIVEAVEDLACKYDIIEGKGRITKMNFSNPDNVVIKFDFTPASKRSSKYPEISNEGRLFNVNGVGKYPSKDWCEKNGIEQGASFPCNKYELKNPAAAGKCEAVKFNFSGFENNGW